MDALFWSTAAGWLDRHKGCDRRPGHRAEELGSGGDELAFAFQTSEGWAAGRTPKLGRPAGLRHDFEDRRRMDMTVSTGSATGATACRTCQFGSALLGSLSHLKPGDVDWSNSPSPTGSVTYIAAAWKRPEDVSPKIILRS